MITITHTTEIITSIDGDKITARCKGNSITRQTELDAAYAVALRLYGEKLTSLQRNVSCHHGDKSQGLWSATLKVHRQFC